MMLKQCSFAREKNCLSDDKGCHTSDWISRLPDDILASIVSRLTLKDAGRTSVLGHRWRYLWTSIPSLDFDGSEQLWGCNKLNRKKKSLQKERIKYVNWVNAIVNLHSGPTLEQFRVQFDFTGQFADDVDNWIKFALGKRVKRLELDFRACGQDTRPQSYAFPDICDPTERSRVIPIGLPSLSFLKTLCLIYVNVTGEVLEYLISNSPCLEQLCVYDSDFLVDLKIGPSIRLKSVKIYRCSMLRKLEICAPNLISFTYFGPEKVILAMENFPKLVKLSIGYKSYTDLIREIHKFHCLFSQLEALTLITDDLDDPRIVLQPPILPRLTKLELHVHAQNGESLLCFHGLIDAAPCLNELTVKLPWRDGIEERSAYQASSHIYKCLKVIEIVGYVGDNVDVELATYLLERSVSLEKMIIDPYYPDLLYSGRDADEILEDVANDIIMVRERAKHLQTKLPPGASLVIR